MSSRLAAACIAVAACQSGTATGGGSSATAEPSPAFAVGCDGVADALATIVLGDYAVDAKRGHVIARELAACTAANLTRDQMSCAMAAQTRDAVAACAPSLALDVDCGLVIDRVRAAAKRPPTMDAELAAQLERGFQIMRVACDEDDWPISIKQCIVDARSLEACAAKMPKDLQKKLADRVVEELR
nr:hypothetical protein [Kofleriaceae bacterium]